MHAGLHCTPEWATVHTHPQCTLHEGGVVQVRWGTTDCSLLSALHHREVSRTSSDGKGGHAVVCLYLPGRLCQVPTPPHCHTAPVPQPPQQRLSAALNMFECGRCSPVPQQEGCVPLSGELPLVQRRLIAISCYSSWNGRHCPH